MVGTLLREGSGLQAPLPPAPTLEVFQITAQPHFRKPCLTLLTPGAPPPPQHCLSA